MTRTVSSVENAMRILSELCTAGPLGISDLARRLDLSTSTVHRLVTALCSQRFARRAPDGARYEIGPAMAPSSAVTPVEHCVFVARPHMRSLRDAVEETVHLCVLRGGDVLFVASIESPRAVRVESRVGSRPRAEVTAAGKVLLAEAGRGRPPAVPPRPTGEASAAQDRLARVLERTRTDGYARNLRESEADMYAIAVPLRRPGGSVTCALSIAAPYSRVDPGPVALAAGERLFLEQLRRTARGIEAGLAF